MRHCLNAAALAAPLLLAATSAGAIDNERLFFEGAARFTAVNATCSDQGAADAGDTTFFSFQRDIRPNRNRDSMRFYIGRIDYAFSARKADGSPGLFQARGKYEGVYIFSRGNTGVQPGTYSGIRFEPAQVTPTTMQVKIVGSIADFDVTGCTITFEAVALRRPI